MGNFGFQIDYLNILLGQVVSKDIKWTLFYFKLVGVEFVVSGLQPIFEFFSLVKGSFTIMFQLILFFFEFLFNLYDLFFLAA